MEPRVIRTSGDAAGMAAEIARAFAGMEPAAILTFASDGAVLGPLGAALAGAFEGCRIVGCSSAGEFAFGAYRSDCVVAVGLPARHFRVEALRLARLREMPALEWMVALRGASDALAVPEGWRRFGLLLIDGLSLREELVSATIDATLPGLRVFGGSAGDGLRFSRTYLMLDGEVSGEGAVLCLIATDFDVAEVVFDHISPTGTRLVVTDARPDERLILEIDAEPAAAAYARMIGADLAALGPADFAQNPLIVRIGGRQFVRAISEATGDGALRLMSSVGRGEVMTLGRAEHLTEGLETVLSRHAGAALILGFDCILRRIALERAGEQDTVDRLFRRYNVAGFNTYGEQHGGMHVNQTFVGLAFSQPEAR